MESFWCDNFPANNFTIRRRWSNKIANWFGFYFIHNKYHIKEHSKCGSQKSECDNSMKTLLYWCQSQLKNKKKKRKKKAVHILFYRYGVIVRQLFFENSFRIFIEFTWLRWSKYMPSIICFGSAFFHQHHKLSEILAKTLTQLFCQYMEDIMRSIKFKMHLL